MYTLLCGYPPFHHDHVQDIQRLFRVICSGFYIFDSPFWDTISESAKDVVKKMLVLDPSQRATASELLQHEWFQQVDSTISQNVKLTLFIIL